MAYEYFCERFSLYVLQEAQAKVPRRPDLGLRQVISQIVSVIETAGSWSFEGLSASMYDCAHSALHLHASRASTCAFPPSGDVSPT